MLTSPLLIVTLLTGAMLTLRPVADFLFWPMSPPARSPNRWQRRRRRAARWLRTSIGARRWRKCSAATLRRTARPEHSYEPPASSFAFERVSRTSGCPTGERLSGSIQRTGASSTASMRRSLPLAARAFNIVYPIHSVHESAASSTRLQ
jgi:hypothetical protein